MDLKSLGVESCDAQPSLFFSREKQIAIEVHVDDFDIAGPDEAVEELLSQLQKMYLMKVGPPQGEHCTTEFLGRRKARTAEGLYTAPSRKLIDEVLNLVDLTGCRAVATPIEKMRPEHRDSEELSVEDGGVYRSAVGKLLFISKDRPDLGFAVKELCRDVKNPDGQKLEKIEAVLAVLGGQPRLGHLHEEERQGFYHEAEVGGFRGL